MKKIILLLFLLCFISPVYAVYFYYGDELVPNMYMVRDSGVSAESSAVYLVKRVDTKEYAYCIEPLTLLNRNSNYIEYNYNANQFNMSDEVLKKINLIAYYGYQYKTHNDIAWYGITQYLIWKTIFPTYNFYFADARFGNKVNTYDNMVLELENLVKKDLTGLDIKTSYDLKTGYEYEIINDSLLNEYELIVPSDIDVKIKNNKLIVKSNIAGHYQVKLKHKNWRFNHYFLYDSYDAQDLFISGYIDNEYTLNFDFKDTKLIVNKIDDKYSIYGNLSVDGAIYNLYDSNNNLISSKEVIDGKMEFLLPIGTYYLEEVKPSYGFKINDKEKIVLNDDREYNTYEDRIYKHVIIHKQYNDKNKLFDEENAVFDLYLDDLKLYSLTTNELGLIELDLPYGNYKLVQTKGLTNYNLASDKEFIIDDNYQDDVMEIINYKKEVLGSNKILLKYDVPDTYLDSNYTYYSFIDFILLIIHVFEKIYI